MQKINLQVHDSRGNVYNIHEVGCGQLVLLGTKSYISSIKLEYAEKMEVLLADGEVFVSPGIVMAII